MNNGSKVHKAFSTIEIAYIDWDEAGFRYCNLGITIETLCRIAIVLTLAEYNPFVRLSTMDINVRT